jgi:hypothetical protein
LVGLVGEKMENVIRAQARIMDREKNPFGARNLLFAGAF